MGFNNIFFGIWSQEAFLSKTEGIFTTCFVFYSNSTMNSTGICILIRIYEKNVCCNKKLKLNKSIFSQQIYKPRHDMMPSILRDVEMKIWSKTILFNNIFKHKYSRHCMPSSYYFQHSLVWWKIISPLLMLTCSYECIYLCNKKNSSFKQII